MADLGPYAGQFQGAVPSQATHQDWNQNWKDKGARGGVDLAGPSQIQWQSYNPQRFERYGTENEAAQKQLASMMMGAAQGNAPSAAEAMMGSAGAQNQANLRNALASAAASDRGIGFAARSSAANRQAAEAAGQMMSQQTSQIAQLRAQEMAQARAALGQQLSGMRGADIQGYGVGQQMEALRVQQNMAELDAAKAQAEMEQRFREQKAKETSDIIGGAMQGIGAIASFASDERLKRNVKDAAGDKVRALLDAIKAKTYDYRRGYGSNGDKDHLGVMAQDLEKSEVGKTLVHDFDTPDGKRKAVDMRRALAAALASAAHLNQRVKKLEASRAR